ncbi:MAG: DUF1273 domain-containing protein [Defluviitaleaceae bacterium]|nr:DUF1273 domain-containing protein [Defluviitaleaceae bacterium]
MNTKDSTCFFVGHTALSQKAIERTTLRLHAEIDKLIRQGVTDFVSMGKLGFDLLAASIVISKKQQGANVRLKFALPCRNQDKRWSSTQKQLCQSLQSETDEVFYLSEECDYYCTIRCVRYLTDNSAYCIYASFYSVGEIAETAHYAQQKGLQVINAAN